MQKLGRQEENIEQKIVMAVKRMEKLGFLEEETMSALKYLLKVHNGNWSLIQKDGYTAIVEYIIDKKQESMKPMRMTSLEQAAVTSPTSPPTPEPRSSRTNRSRSEESGRSDKKYSVVMYGLSKKKLKNPVDIKTYLENMVKNNLEIWPRQELVESVMYCSHEVEDFAVVIVTSELAAELILEICERTEELKSCPFRAEGRLLRVKRNFPAKEPPAEIVKLRISADSRIIYVRGIPDEWAETHRLKMYFGSILQGLESETGINVVRKVHIVPGAAYIELSCQAAVDILFYRCGKDRKLTSAVSEDLTICHGLKFVPQLRCSGVDIQNKVDNTNQQDVKIVEPSAEKCEPFQVAGQHQNGNAARETCSAPSEAPRKGTERVQLRTEQGPFAITPDKALDEPYVDKPVESPSSSSETMFEDASLQEVASSARPCPNITNSARREDKPRREPVKMSFRKTENLVKEKPEQRSLMIVNFSKDFNAIAVRKLLVKILLKVMPNATASESKIDVLWQTGQAHAQVVTNSEAIADTLMSAYIRHTTEFCLDMKFSIVRDKLYVRPRAMYRQNRLTSLVKKAILLYGLDGIQGILHLQQLKGALSELLDRVLLTQGVLEMENSLLKELRYPGHNYAVMTLEEAVAGILMSTTRTLELAGATLTVELYQSTDFVAQASLQIQNLPSTAAAYNPNGLKTLIRDMIKKVRPETITTECITNMTWRPGSTYSQVRFESEDIAETLMDAYILHAEEFSIDELPLTIYRHNGYVRPGAVYRTPSGYPSGTMALVVHGLKTMNSIPLKGALRELIERAVADKGVLDRHTSVLQKFFSKKGANQYAKIIVDEAVGAKLLSLKKPLILAGQTLSVVSAPDGGPWNIQQPPPYGPPTYGMGLYPPVHSMEWCPEARTGGWIDEDSMEEGEISHLDHCIKATLESIEPGPPGI